MWVTYKLLPSPIMISSGSSYSEWRYRLWRSVVKWWEALESTSQGEEDADGAAKWALGWEVGCLGGGPKRDDCNIDGEF